MVTRRALSNLLLLPAMQAQVNTSDLLPDLHLSPAEQRQIAQEAEHALRQARWLEELPLDDVAPGFLFVAR